MIRRQEQFYEKLVDGDISTSMPMVGSVTDTWDKLFTGVR